MAIRDDIQNFPLSNNSRGIWYYTIDWNNNQIEEIGSGSLRRIAQDILDGKCNIQIMGMWQGNWRTDAFKLTPEFILENIK